MRQCKHCDNNQNYHLVPVIHPSNPDNVEHLCLDCLNKEIVKTGEIKVTPNTQAELNKFSREMKRFWVIARNPKRPDDMRVPYCAYCERRLDSCQSIQRVSIPNKKTAGNAPPTDEKGNAMTFMCNECIKAGNKPKFAVCKVDQSRWGEDIILVDVDDLEDNLVV